MICKYAFANTSSDRIFSSKYMKEKTKEKADMLWFVVFIGGVVAGFISYLMFNLSLEEVIETAFFIVLVFAVIIVWYHISKLIVRKVTGKKV